MARRRRWKRAGGEGNLNASAIVLCEIRWRCDAVCARLYLSLFRPFTLVRPLYISCAFPFLFTSGIEAEAETSINAATS